MNPNKRRGNLNLVAVVATIVFMLVYAVPWVRNAAAVDACVAEGGRWDSENALCEK